MWFISHQGTFLPRLCWFMLVYMVVIAFAVIILFHLTKVDYYYKFMLLYGFLQRFLFYVCESRASSSFIALKCKTNYFF